MVNIYPNCLFLFDFAYGPPNMQTHLFANLRFETLILAIYCNFGQKNPPMFQYEILTSVFF
jgi:hypothetical protein